MSEAWPWKPPEGWWIMMFECGRLKRLPFAPAVNRSDPADAANPTHRVEISGRTYWLVSYIASAEVTTPPGELMESAISLLGFSDSRNSSWAQTRLAMWSFTGPTT